jgi:hypothetical protein
MTTPRAYIFKQKVSKNDAGENDAGSAILDLSNPDCVTVPAATLGAPVVKIVMFETTICAPG